MKIHVEMEENEYELFREYRDVIISKGTYVEQIKRLREERDRLMTLINDKFPTKRLIIHCNGLNEPASYTLEDDDEKED